MGARGKEVAHGAEHRAGDEESGGHELLADGADGEAHFGGSGGFGGEAGIAVGFGEGDFAGRQERAEGLHHDDPAWHRGFAGDGVRRS